MLGSPNVRRGNIPFAMRLKIDDLRAHLASLDHYGLPGLSSSMTNGVCALARAARRSLLRRGLGRLPIAASKPH